MSQRTDTLTHDMDEHVDDMTRSCTHLSQCGVSHIMKHVRCAREKVTCEVLPSTFPCEEILSGYEDVVSSGTDQFTSRVKTDLMLPWYDMWSMFKKPLQIFARHQKGDTIHLLRHTASTKMCLIVRMRKSDPASTTGILGLDVRRKMLLRNQSQANGMSSHYKKHLSMSIMTLSQIVST